MSKITIYSTSTCGYCKMLKSYLQNHDITYDEKIADEDQSLAKELYEKSGQLGVPFTIIEQDNGEEVSVLGFDRHKIDHALGLAK
ncbi:MAG: glutaredoxin family protein [Candidatus Saccharibacteria bacterium]|nr:glutaredoxin family protein [Candidatus Saccharibacteria bacterium]